MQPPSFAVSDEKNRWLLRRMAELEVREEELEERFVRSSGRGGQHVNKTATCVQVRHLPSGIEARCGRERSQSLNRFLARRELLEKIARSRGLATTEDTRSAKIRKQKARRQRRSASATPAPDQP
ncbi:peptide chain release factor-like protein [Trichlorobacter sp.]|jgi:protein subunit release factor B|uniref:peptide chain release factor family protein n=1 Tax=Trichlorobacter sp. TaxID=2911007 RepID=UPI002A35A344|nr:peptide chain release factor-like protein [Trichlorobacter sp.]MDY0384063.1 peptide chain release factor-like protein [Trichlorobacter sp.]